MRLAIDKQEDIARNLVVKFTDVLGQDFVDQLLNSNQKSEEEIANQRNRVAILKEKLEGIDSPDAKRLLDVADYLVRKSVWIIGGDGWAYMILATAVWTTFLPQAKMSIFLCSI
jgi:pyruvate-ferredoxin/flavodoxin oxidoreductase